MSYASIIALTTDRYSAPHVRRIAGTGSGYDGIVDSFGASVVSYWKFANTGVDERGVANAIISGSPEMGVPSIVTPDRVVEGAPADGEIIAWPGSINEYAQAAFNAAHKTLEGTIVVTFQCDTLNQVATLIASNNTPSQPGELVIQVNTNGSPQANLRNAAGTPVTLVGQPGDVVLNRAYTIIVKHGTAGFSMALYNDAHVLVRRVTNALATGQAAGLSPIRFFAWHDDTAHLAGPGGRVVWLNRRLSDAEEVVLAGARTIAHGGTGPPPGGYDDAPITTRNPKLYLQLEEVSGSPVDSAGAGYAGSISVLGGTPLAYGVQTTKGRGIRLGTAAYIQAAHHTVFETPNHDGTGAPYNANIIVESEATFSIHCAFPAALQNNWVIFAKDDNETDLLPGISLRVHANGSVELRVREHKYRPDVRMFAPAGTITVGSEHHFTVSVGYQGAWFTVDGRQVELGYKNTLAWWGLDHRRNGIEEAGSAAATSVRTTNTSAIRLGRTGEQSTSADIVVTKFALFHSGAIRTARGQITLGFTLAACQALAGASGTAFADPRFAPPTAATTPAPGTNTIQAAIEAASPGGTVLINGNYTQSVDLILRSGMRMTTTTGATITLTGATTQVVTPFPVTGPTLTGGGDLAVGSSSYAVTVPAVISNADQESVFLVVETTAIGALYGVTGSTANPASVENPASRRSDLIPIRARTGSSLTFTRGTYFNHPAGTRAGIIALNFNRDILVDGNITIRKNVAATAWADPVVYIHGVRRCAFRGITILQQNTAPTSGGGIIACKFQGCVEVQMNGCTVDTRSPLGDLSMLPYSTQFHGCAHYDIYDLTGSSAGWHGLDNEVRNFMAIWGIGGPSGSLYGGQFGDCRNSNMDSGTNNFGAITHDSSNCTIQDVYHTNAGVAIAGWGHDFNCNLYDGPRAAPLNAIISFSRGCGGLYLWHCDFNDTLGSWGGGAHGLRRSSFGDLHYQGTKPGTSGPAPTPHDASNTFTDVDAATNGMPF